MIIYGTECEQNVSVVGGKARGLFLLKKYGFRVPDFFVIAAGTDITSDNFSRELRLYADRLNCELFSVRSSGVAEDGASMSFAGQFETELNVTIDELANAVRRVYASASKCRATVYYKRLDSRPCDMAVIVQKQIIGSESGVLFSTSPHDSNKVIIECASGCGDNIVGGKLIPKSLSYDKSDRAEGYYAELLSVAASLEKSEGCPVDVEWSYDGTLWFLQLRRQTVLSDIIPLVPNRKWNFYVFRDFTVFNHSVQAAASDPLIQERMFGFSVPIKECLLLCGREFYSDENEIATNNRWTRLDVGDFFQMFLEKIEASIRCTQKRTTFVRKKDYSVLSDSALLSEFSREIMFYTQSYVPMMMRPDDYLFGRLVKISGAKRAQKITEAVRDTLPPTYYSRERTAFLRAVSTGDNHDYLEKYEWKNNPLGKQFVSVTEHEFSRRAAELNAERAEELLRTIAREKRRSAAHARRTISNCTDEEKRVIWLISRFMYYRTRTAEYSDRYFYYIRKSIIAEIARRIGISDQTLLLYRFNEFVALLSDGKRLDETDIIKRKGGEAIIFNDGAFSTYFGASAYGLLRKIMPETKKTDVIYGSIACAGEVIGSVKVVKSFADAENMEAGNILVTSMTTPDITLALEKAIGIITDEGGITCHAAIIAREYSIPCLVGTECATQLLRDGMRVKLDCVNGYFRIFD